MNHKGGDLCPKGNHYNVPVVSGIRACALSHIVICSGKAKRAPPLPRGLRRPHGGRVGTTGQGAGGGESPEPGRRRGEGGAGVWVSRFGLGESLWA